MMPLISSHAAAKPCFSTELVTVWYEMQGCISPFQLMWQVLYPEEQGTGLTGL